MNSEKVRELAQGLIDNLNQEMQTKQADALRLEGATQGVNLLYTKIVQEQDNVQDNKSKKKK